MNAAVVDDGFGRGDFGMPNSVVNDSADRTAVWDSMDQSELYQSFFWTSTPSVSYTHLTLPTTD